MKTHSIVDTGFDGHPTDIECSITNGLPSITIVGLANKAIDEAKERMRSAFAACAISFPKKRIVVNLAPADIPKEGSSHDLAIASAVLLASEQIKPLGERTVVIGELGLDGAIHPIRGVVGKLLAARKHGFKQAIIPDANYQQACLVDGLEFYPVKTLDQLYMHASGSKILKPHRSSSALKHSPDLNKEQGFDLSYISGQETAKRALEIAAAGQHNVLLNGPPGTGKSMLAKSLATILPSMNHGEILETTQLHSLTGLTYDQIVLNRPIRSPHHSASDTAIIGGGTHPKPGEISLAHNGVLLFDEFPEFHRAALEALRQPLEDGLITVARAKDSVTFPAEFILVATANPCPCGFWGTHRDCSCTPSQLHRYRRKLSGPIIDRIDLFVEVEHVKHQQLLEKNSGGQTSQVVRKRVTSARDRQRTRQRHLNSQITSQDLRTQKYISPKAKELLDTAARKLQLSPRAYMRTIKVARTIADLADNHNIHTQHVAEALQFRPKPVSDL